MLQGTTAARRSRSDGAAGRLAARLTEHVDVASLVAFRIGFGVILVWSAWRSFDHGWIDSKFVTPALHFWYGPLEFIAPLGSPWIHLVFLASGVAALYLAIGLFTRTSAAVLTLTVTYIFLIDKTDYLNHAYLVCLISFLLVFLPLNRAASVDAWRTPAVRARTVPAWTVWLLRFQVAVPYFFGGIAKLNADWFRGEPLRSWLASRTDTPVIGRFLDDEAAVQLMNHGATVLDLAVVPLLLWRRTRAWAFLAAAGFHLLNASLFNIGIFPWAMLAMTTIFFEPDWPLRISRAVSERDRSRIAALALGGIAGFVLGGWFPSTFSLVRAVVGAAAIAVGVFFVAERRAEAASSPSDAPPRPPLRRAALVALTLWVAVQVLVPLRHFAIPGLVHWTNEGHRFAWHMKLLDRTGSVRFTVEDPLHGTRFSPNLDDYLTRTQQREMRTRPDMIVQFAHMLEDHLRSRGSGDVRITVDAHMSLNGRVPQRLIDPEQDLTAVSFPWWPPGAEWILPLTTPLER